MSEKGFFASLCSFFAGLFSSDTESTASNASGDGLTGVERYIRNQASSAAPAAMTSVEQYIQNQASTEQLTGVEQYIRNQG